LSRSLNGPDESNGAAIQAIKGRLEHLVRSIPRVSNRTGNVEPRVKVTCNHDSSASGWKKSGELPGLPRIHDDNKIRPSDG
jgi:hypothetical protein